ncbi:MAG: hypothetical protein HY884_09180 [Deltaproteobacteria bacterium]|nr:hypothetical protein [Deltaproteobacteria bacterium]
MASSSKGLVRRICAAIALIAVAATASSCSGPLQQAFLNIREPFRSPDFVSIGAQDTVGLITAANHDNGLEYRKLLGDFVEEALKKERPDIKVIPYWQTLSVINTGGYTADYARMLNTYTTTGILDKDVLTKLGAALGAKYLIHPRIIDFNQKQTIRFQPFGFTMFLTHETEIKIYMEVWDAKNGAIVWIGAAEAHMASEHFMSKPIPFEEVAKLTIETLLKKMPLGAKAIKTAAEDAKK